MVQKYPVGNVLKQKSYGFPRKNFVVKAAGVYALLQPALFWKEVD